MRPDQVACPFISERVLSLYNLVESLCRCFLVSWYRDEGHSKPARAGTRFTVTVNAVAVIYFPPLVRNKKTQFAIECCNFVQPHSCFHGREVYPVLSIGGKAQQ